jgi:hypothetical protein
LLLLAIAPSRSSYSSNGSTYSRTPAGYGAWYAYMQAHGTPVRRWQRPLADLAKLEPESSATLLQVNPNLDYPDLPLEALQNWIERGNRLVVLGVHQPVSGAVFSTVQESQVGSVRVDTRRRYLPETPPSSENGKRTPSNASLLGDRYGAVVWQQDIGRGSAIFVTTPHLAANAYQDEAGNFPFLAQLVGRDRALYADEFLHGYRDADALSGDRPSSLFAYLADTPLLLVALQVAVGITLLVWAQNRRFGVLQPLVSPVRDNSTAYIEALAGVLHKAGSHQFAIATVGRAERQALQVALGLGSTPVELAGLVQAWTRATGRSAQELTLQLDGPRPQASEGEWLRWLTGWRSLQNHLPQPVRENVSQEVTHD